MSEKPRYRDAHLIVAAIRVQEELHHRPPTVAEIAETLSWNAEKAGVIARGLEELKIIDAVKSPYDVRYDVGEHTKLEELAQEDQDSGFADELEIFQDQRDEEQALLEQAFDSGEHEKQRQAKIDALDDDFQNFRKSRPDNPFGDKG